MKLSKQIIIFKLLFALLILAFILTASSCKKTFDYSVYSAGVPKYYRDTRNENLQWINSIMAKHPEDSSYKIALIADSHTYYDDLDDAVSVIKSDPELKFIIHAGDMTDGGILEEYQLFHYIMSKSKKPYITVIGNHDCLANGYTIYKEIYGNEDYYVKIGNCKFIFFNDISWELNNREPDYFWLHNQLADTAGYDHIFVIAHIPPYSEVFTPLQRAAYTTLMADYNVSMSIHGHIHKHYYGNYYNDSVKYLTIGATYNRLYVELTVYKDSVSMQKIPF